MSDISQLYTQTTGPTPTGTGSTSALFGGATSAGGSFLDMILAALLTRSAPVTSGTPSNTTTDVPSEDSPLPATTDVPMEETGDENAVVAGLNPALFQTQTVPVNTGETVEAVATDTPVDPAALNAIEPGTADYTETLDARLKAQVLALLKQNGIDVPQLPAAPAAATPAPEAAVPLTTSLPIDDTTKIMPAVVTADLPVDAEPTNEVAVQLNAMTVGAGDKTTAKTDTKGKPVNLLDGLMKGADAVPDARYQPVNAPANGGYQPNLNAQQAPAESQTLNAPANDGTDILPDDAVFKLDLSALTPENLTGLLQANAQVSKNAVKTAANGNGHAQSSSALNAVAIHLQTMAQNRDTRSMTLHLNPPELGKLQVKMSYGKDKTVKADVLVEKADTFSMLQKDVDNLKQALQNAGLQADAGSLNFTLADQGGFDNMMQSAENGDGTERIVGDDTSDIALIEIKSSEEWSVDPKTGIVRYNIVV